MKILDMFSGAGAEGYNILMTALLECAKDENADVYEWLDKTPKTTRVGRLMDKIRELGYEILPKPINQD